MTTEGQKVRVTLVSTASVDAPGSMRAYADTLLAAMKRYVPDIEVRLVELDPNPSHGRWIRRLQTALLPLRARRLARNPPHVWHVLDGSRAYVGNYLGTAPVLVTVHDVIPWLQDQGKFPGASPLSRAARWWWKGNAKAMQRAVRLVCVSSCSAKDVSEAFALSAGACVVVPLPLRAGLEAPPAGDRQRQASRTNMILHVGNNGFYKNREGVLRVFALLDPAMRTTMIMVGPEPTSNLTRLAESLGIAERVQWLVEPADSLLAQLYSRAGVLVYPSLYEGFGWPVLEAMSQGVPVVCSNAGSLPEVVGVAGPTFHPDDLQGMADAIAQLLKSPADAAAASARGLEQALKFDARDFARNMALTYRAAAGAIRESSQATVPVGAA